MEPFCYAKGIPLFAEPDSFISFSNSPYIGHRTGTAVDIYPAHQEWRTSIQSPIHGKIIFSKRLTMGAKREFQSEEFDYAIGIQPDENSNTCVRVLHCKPIVEIGDYVDTGSMLGDAIRSRYFNYWTGPHAHVDVLEKQNFLRSSQSFKLNVHGNPLSLQNHEGMGSLECRAVRVTDDYVIATSKNIPTASDGRFFGHVGKLQAQESFGIIDAGLPHYKFGGLYTNDTLDKDECIDAWKMKIGRIKTHNAGISVFSMNSKLQIFLNDQAVKGISCFLYSKHQLIKGQIPIHIIPLQYGSLSANIQEGNSFTLNFSESESDNPVF